MKAAPHYPGDPEDRLENRRFLVSLDTTSQCNLRCRHCWLEAVRARGYDFDNEIMPLELFERISGEFKGLCRSFALSCGFEPLINRDFETYLEHAVRDGHPDVHCYTNGLLLTPERARRIVEIGPDRLVFSLESVAEQAFSHLRRGAQLEDLVRRLEALRHARRDAGAGRPAIEFNWVLMPRNLGELDALADFAARLDAARVHFIPHVRWADAEFQEPSLAEMDAAEVSDAVDRFCERCRGRGVEVNDSLIRDLFPRPPATLGGRVKRWARRLLPRRASELACPQPWEIVMIGPSGRFIPCTGGLVDRVYGDFRTQTLEEIWNGPEMRALREGLKGRQAPCEHCLRCSHFRARDKKKRFYEPRAIDPEQLGKLLPSIRRHDGGGT